MYETALSRLHVHVEKASADCDGTYVHEDHIGLTSEDRADQFGDIHFRERIVGQTVNSYCGLGGRLDVRSHEDMVVSLEWNEPTDEGYRHVSVDFCSRKRCAPRF
jgi:hypothetical protein